MRTAVITTVHGRGRHLRRQLAGLAASTHQADVHVVVALGDPAVASIVADAGSPAIVVPRKMDGALAVAEGRNTGAAVALEHDADLLVFLDVDCIPGASLLGLYHSAAMDSEHADALLCGPVTYLPPPGPEGYDLSRIQDDPRPHPARPAPPDGTIAITDDYTLFWSLSFALRASTWSRIGGFCERYRGYGAEDTDFGQCAHLRGVPMRWVGGAHAFHQYHGSADPPVNHLDDILRNAGVFHERWGWWPMEGWLDAFESRGLISRDADGRPNRRDTAA